MTTRMSMFLLTGAIGLTLTGCSATSPVMRGQSPSATFASYGHGSCDPSGCPHPSCQPCDSYGAACRCEPGSCHGGNECLNLPFHPVHRNFHTYEVPRGLMYPQDNTPAAVYQYPYYTTRGPTDFFMK